ncbi:metallophosphoesterase [Myroides sp. N17-2]|uniref:metallophosphoesterase n=1 Tax=Myroides sp. N17-2 TaxID=2030799 RepID=UPI000EFBFE07|nr:metallophosphoesterase [Myroides sp. N17-2]
MQYFIIGDIHGCYHTFCSLLEQWDSQTEHLILVGDLIDRGNYSWLVINKCCALLAEPSVSVTILKGNHEAELIQYIHDGHHEIWTSQCGLATLADFEKHSVDLSHLLPWLENLSLKYETSSFIITHAGVSDTINPYDESNWDGVLWTRKPLANLHKLQVHGHTPLKQNHPQYTLDSNSYNIDTGAYYGYGLTGIKLSPQAEVLDIITIPTDIRDIE